MLFGLPFFLAGMYVLLGALDIIPIRMEQNQPRILFVGFGALFSTVGAALMFGRAGMTLDRRTMKLVKWWGLAVPMKTKEINLGLFQRVTIGRERRKSGKSSRIVYPVKIEDYEGLETIEYEAPGEYQEARQLGEELAEFLNMNLEDSSSGKKIVRESSRLDESLRQRLKRTGEKPAPVSPPCEMRSKVLESDGGISIEIPAQRLKAVHLLHIVPGLLFASCVYFFFFRGFMGLPAPRIVHVIFGTVILVFFIIAPISVSFGQALSRASQRYVIAVNPGRLSVQERRFLGSKKTEIPLDELEELELVKANVPTDSAEYEKRRGRPFTSQEELQMQRMLDSTSFFSKLLKSLASPRIVARSDRQTIEFGNGLAGEELRYLHDSILKAIREN
jgi:hypothetical protein